MKYVLALSLALFVYACAAFGAPTFHRMESVPAELLGKEVDLSGLMTASLEEVVRFEKIQFELGKNGETRVSMPGSRTLSVDRMPEIPMVLKKMTLPKGKQARVAFVNAVLEESDAVIAMKAAPEAHVWEPQHDFKIGADPDGRYFPGKLYEAKIEDGHVNVLFYPVQIDRRTGKVLLLKSGKLQLTYLDLNAHTESTGSAAGGGVILTSEKFATAAKTLQAFHAKEFGVQSEIVTVESVAKTEKAVSEDDLPDGYKKKDLQDSIAQNYPYETAKKLIAFMQKRMIAGTKYLTILGDAEAVPPSYYFSVRSGFGVKTGPTDLCYGAVKRCTDVKIAVGRLPFKTEAELTNHLSKVVAWAKYADNASSELALFGGKAFPVDVYVGELGTSKTLLASEVNWRGVKKFYRTKKNYNKREMLDMVEGNKASAFVYHLDHGNGNQWYVEREFVTSNEVLNAKAGSNAVTPVVVSIACTDAAYDETLAKEVIFPTQTDGKVSVGVAMLRSKAGAVAYLGSGRPALGTTSYNVDKNGNLTLNGTTYGLQMFDTFFEKYHASTDARLGDMVIAMYRAYANENGNDLTNDRNKWTYYNVVLLGDPAMRLPSRKQKETVHAVAKSKTLLEEVSSGFPTFSTKSSELLLKFDAPSEVLASVLKIARGGTSEELVAEKKLSGDASLPVSLSEDSEGTYFIRLENTQGVPVERQVWMKGQDD